jgi:hypothetical protein
MEITFQKGSVGLMASKQQAMVMCIAGFTSEITPSAMNMITRYYGGMSKLLADAINVIVIENLSGKEMVYKSLVNEVNTNFKRIASNPDIYPKLAFVDVLFHYNRLMQLAQYVISPYLTAGIDLLTNELLLESSIHGTNPSDWQWVSRVDSVELVSPNDISVTYSLELLV